MSTSHARTVRGEDGERPFIDTLLHRRWFLLVLVAVALLFTGCGSGPSDAEVTKILGIIAASSLLSKFRSKVGTEFDHFVKHRIKALLTENSGWDSPPKYIILTTRISKEIDKIIPYVEGKVGTPGAPGKLGSAIDPDTPPHTDLKDVAKIYLDDGDDIIKQRQDKYVNARRERVRRIIWRALAVHTNLWKSPSSMTDFNWHEAALEEVLDRRLRFVERMLYTDDAQVDRGKRWTITAEGGPWKDNTRTILFEYPFIQQVSDTSAGSFGAALAAAGLTPGGLAPTFTHEGPPRNEIRFHVRSGRIRPPASGNWERDGYEWEMKLAGKKPSEILDLLVPATSPVNAAFQDFWQRSWIFCDHMVSALEVDALRFGLRRRTGSDTEFNDEADDGVTLTALIPESSKPDPDDLMDEGSDYFEGALIRVADLQIGDLVIIWNNYFFRTVFGTDFGLENSVVTNLYGEESRNVKLVGHGASEDGYSEFVAALASSLDSVMSGLRKFITKKITAEDPDHDYLLFGAVIKANTPAFSVELVYWAPFDETLEPADGTQELAVPGAWWMRVRLDTYNLELDAALHLFPKSVAIDTSRHTPPKLLEGTNADFKESIYIPLSMPKGVRGGWETYLAGPAPSGTVKLEDAKTDSGWAPGFNYAGPNTKIPVLRPKVRT